MRSNINAVHVRAGQHVASVSVDVPVTVKSPVTVTDTAVMPMAFGSMRMCVAPSSCASMVRGLSFRCTYVAPSLDCSTSPSPASDTDRQHKPRNADGVLNFHNIF